MRRSDDGENVDFSQRHAGRTFQDEDDPLRDPLVRELRDIMPFHPMWNDPEAVRRFRDNLYDRLAGKEPAGTEEQDMRQKVTDENEQFMAGGAKEWAKYLNRKL